MKRSLRKPQRRWVNRSNQLISKVGTSGCVFVNTERMSTPQTLESVVECQGRNPAASGQPGQQLRSLRGAAELAEGQGSDLLVIHQIYSSSLSCLFGCSEARILSSASINKTLHIDLTTGKGKIQLPARRINPTVASRQTAPKPENTAPWPLNMCVLTVHLTEVPSLLLTSVIESS